MSKAHPDIDPDDSKSPTTDGKRAFAVTPEERYTIRKKLGSGGMATVYDAIDYDLRRHIAIKILRDEHHNRSAYDSEDRPATQRFIEEAQITGQLEHPNIVPVHEIGYDDGGRLFFTMKRVVGATLGEILDALREGDDEALEKYHHHKLMEVFLKTGDAIRFAHDRDVLHRDLKPDNIMVASFGEVQVMDWGLAKVIGAIEPEPEDSAKDTISGFVSTDGGNPLNTIDGTISGTPAYMPPEQARGETTKIDKRTDVFLLGAMLYELITLIPPFTASSSMKALRKAQKHELESPGDAVEAASRAGRLEDDTPFPEAARNRARSYPKALAAIAMKALAEEPEDRYQSVKELTDDVRAWRAGRAVSVFCESPLTRLFKLAGRHRAASVAIIAFVVLLLLSLATIGMIGQRVQTDRAEAESRDAKNERLLRAQAEDINAEKDAEAMRASARESRFQRRNRAQDHRGIALNIHSRASQIADQERRANAMREALGHAEAAVAEDPTFAGAFVTLGTISFDLGRVIDARRYLLQAIDVADASDTSIDFSSLLTTAAVILSEAVLYSVEDSVFVPLYVTVMKRARAAKTTTEHQRALADLFIEHMPRAVRFEQSAKGSQERASLLEDLRNDARRLRDLRRKLESGRALSYWELVLMESWHQMQGWGYNAEEMKRLSVMDLVRGADAKIDQALAIRPQLPIAWALRALLRVETQRAIGKATGSVNLVMISNAAAEVWDTYIKRFQFDPAGHYSLGQVKSRLLFGRKADLDGAIASYTRAIELEPSNLYARRGLALAYEARGSQNHASKVFEDLETKWRPEFDFPVEATAPYGLWRSPMASSFDFNFRNQEDAWKRNRARFTRVTSAFPKDTKTRDYYLAVLVDSAWRYQALENLDDAFWESYPTDTQAWVDVFVARRIASETPKNEAIARLLDRAQNKTSDKALLAKIAQIRASEPSVIGKVRFEGTTEDLSRDLKILRFGVSVPEASRALLTVRDRFSASSDTEEKARLRQVMLQLYFLLAGVDDHSAAKACDRCAILNQIVEENLAEPLTPLLPANAR